MGGSDLKETCSWNGSIGWKGRTLQTQGCCSLKKTGLITSVRENLERKIARPKSGRKALLYGDDDWPPV